MKDAEAALRFGGRRYRPEYGPRDTEYSDRRSVFPDKIRLSTIEGQTP